MARKRSKKAPEPKAGGASPALDAARARLGGLGVLGTGAQARRRRGASRSWPTGDGAPSRAPGDSVSASFRTAGGSLGGATSLSESPRGTATLSLSDAPCPCTKSSLPAIESVSFAAVVSLQFEAALLE